MPAAVPTSDMSFACDWPARVQSARLPGPRGVTITLNEQVRHAVGGVALPRKGRHDASARHRLRDAGDRGDGGGERAEEEEGGHLRWCGGGSGES